MHFSVNILITIDSETKFYSISSVVEDLCVFVAAFKFFVPYATTPITLLQDLILTEILPNSCFFFFQVTTYTCVMIFRHFYLKRNSIFKPNLHQDAHPTKKKSHLSRTRRSEILKISNMYKKCSVLPEVTLMYVLKSTKSFTMCTFLFQDISHFVCCVRDKIRISICPVRDKI